MMCYPLAPREFDGLGAANNRRNFRVRKQPKSSSLASAPSVDLTCPLKQTPAENSSCRSSKLRAGTTSRTQSPSSARITDGRIVPVGKGFIRKPPKRVDYLLRYTRDFPLAVVEAKAAYKSAADGLQQAQSLRRNARA